MGADKSKSEILIVGGGFVGLTLTAKLLKSPNTYLTILENNVDKINNFHKQEYGIFEPGLDEILNSSIKSNRLKFVSDLDDLNFELVFICVNTRKIESNRIDKQINLIDSIIKHLVASGHIYLRSTVPVGTTKKIYEYLQNSKRDDLKIFYVPEWTAEGIALDELDSLPQIISSPAINDLKIGINKLASLGFKVIETSNSESAEFIKLMCNIWRDTTFAVANELAIFAESLNLDIFEIIEKANFSYPRSAVPKPGPVGGPCLSKDTYLFLESLDENFADNSIILKSRKQNEALVNIAYNLILEYIDEKPNQNRICFLGAAFKGKPRTNDFRNSFTQELIHMVKESTVEIMVWDPTVKSEDLLDYSNYLNGNLNAKNTSIVIIGNNSDFFFDDVVLNFLTDLPTSSLIIDMWGVTRNIENIRSQVYKFGIKC